VNSKLFSAAILLKELLDFPPQAGSKETQATPKGH